MRYSIIAASFLILITLLMAGCATYDPIKDIEIRRNPLIETFSITEQQPYTESEIRVVGEECIEREYEPTITDETKFMLSHDPKEWVTEPGVLGETNQVRRVANVYNGLDTVRMVYVNKVYYYNNTIFKVSENPLHFLVEPKTTRNLFVLWDTQYDPLKDVKLALTNATEEVETANIMRMCINKTQQFNTTKYKTIDKGDAETIVGYQEIERVNLNTA